MDRAVARKDRARIRREIDRVDRALLRLLSRRWRLVEDVARTKTHAASVYDPARSRQILARIKRMAARHGLPADSAVQIWSLLIDLSVAHQRDRLGTGPTVVRRSEGCRSLPRDQGPARLPAAE